MPFFLLTYQLYSQDYLKVFLIGALCYALVFGAWLQGWLPSTAIESLVVFLPPAMQQSKMLLALPLLDLAAVIALHYQQTGQPWWSGSKQKAVGEEATSPTARPHRLRYYELDSEAESIEQSDPDSEYNLELREQLKARKEGGGAGRTGGEAARKGGEKDVEKGTKTGMVQTLGATTIVEEPEPEAGDGEMASEELLNDPSLIATARLYGVAVNDLPALAAFLARQQATVNGLQTPLAGPGPSHGDSESSEHSGGERGEDDNWFEETRSPDVVDICSGRADGNIDTIEVQG